MILALVQHFFIGGLLLIIRVKSTVYARSFQLHENGIILFVNEYSDTSLLAIDKKLEIDVAWHDVKISVSYNKLTLPTVYPV
ncbi:hypothetical protein JKQ83_09790 [Listeria monocytogenes]|nr:hypothetical protein [Listeria monocytogenes]